MTRAANQSAPERSLPPFLPPLTGVLVALVVIKFGMPVILDHRIEAPRSFAEIIGNSWPVSWGYVLMAILAGLGFLFGNFRAKGLHWVVWLPLVWLGWQFVSATQSVDMNLTRTVLPHFVVCVVCFYFGLFVLGEARQLKAFWLAIVVGFVVTLGTGLNQRFGSLAETRDYVLKNEATHWRDVKPEEIQDLLKDGILVQNPDGSYSTHPEIMKRVKGGRVYGTFIYPNALAAAILLLLPVGLMTVWQASGNWPRLAGTLAMALLLYMGIGCLYWSGSKGGWLVALGVVGLVLLHAPFPRQWKVALVGLVAVAGLAGFFLKYSDYFGKGATSVGARFGGWEAAIKTTAANPILGSGPGTFGKVYARIKKPEAEMARLTHNDFLEQASDSGIVGFLAYSSLFIGSFIILYRNSSKNLLSMEFAVWVGMLGWAVQSVIEFSLYVPAIAWPAFLLMGWLWGACRNPLDKPPVAG